MIAKGNDFTLGYESGEFVLAGCAEGAELDALNFGADGWGEVVYVDALGEQVWVGRVGVLAVFYVVEWLEGAVFLFWVPGGEVVRVLGMC